MIYNRQILLYVTTITFYKENTFLLLRIIEASDFHVPPRLHNVKSAYLLTCNKIGYFYLLNDVCENLVVADSNFEKANK